MSRKKWQFLIEQLNLPQIGKRIHYPLLSRLIQLVMFSFAEMFYLLPYQLKMLSCEYLMFFLYSTLTIYYSRGNLTYITDDCYNFFLHLKQKLEDYLQVSYLVQNGEQFVYKATNSLFDDDTLKSFIFEFIFSFIKWLGSKILCHCVQ